ncbi:MAG: S-methyl-5'-thioadenosine phosphorylase [Deltaproteobacteria bacterium]|nr:S-methyl-5'-thioadenosine phosphorylase [Deltaproteobacteria bacterium]
MIGIIGGTGLYQLEGLSEIQSHSVDTPFGSPSSKVVVGRIGGTSVAFLARHGIHHKILPTEINYRANIWALKTLGVRQIVSVSAVGSLQAEIKPGDLAMASQYIDFTKGKRNHTFFGEGIVAHISTARPSCPTLSHWIDQSARTVDTLVHKDKTYVCVEGPRLGTRAESEYLRICKADVVGMTNVPEVFLAREAQLCYCTLAVATDYDCWHEDPNMHVSVDQIMALYKQNLGRVQTLIKELVKQQPSGKQDCSCHHALENAVVSPDNDLPPDKRKMLAFLKS